MVCIKTSTLVVFHVYFSIYLSFFPMYDKTQRNYEEKLKVQHCFQSWAVIGCRMAGCGSNWLILLCRGWDAQQHVAVSRQAEEAPRLPGASVQPGEPAGLPLSYETI